MFKNILYQYIHLLNTSSMHKILKDMINTVVKLAREEKNENKRRKKGMKKEEYLFVFLI